LIFGVVYGAWHWWVSVSNNANTPIGTALIATLLIILGVQFCLSALHFDIRNVPTNPYTSGFGGNITVPSSVQQVALQLPGQPNLRS